MKSKRDLRVALKIGAGHMGNRPPKVAEQMLPSTWEMASFAQDDRPDHPTPKPLDAFAIPMRQHVARGGLCYESGSGAQIMAGEANGRRVFAMEISPAYVDVAIARWQAETGKNAILARGYPRAWRHRHHSRPQE